MTSQSAGILLYRKAAQGLEVFLAHHGGPYHAKKDAGHWTIPKGLIEDDEEAKVTAYREFKEEVGCVVPEGDALERR